MGNRRAVSPKSYHENTRDIVRVQRRFDGGMLMEPDTSGLEVGPNTTNPASVQWLNNCRGYRNYIEGDPGTVRFAGADALITIVDNTETRAVAIASGVLFVANGSVALESGWIFEVRGSGDFTGNDLQAVKGDVLRAHDHFRYIGGTDFFQYVGNSRIPALTGFGDTSATEITAVKTGVNVVRSAGPLFDASHTGCYFVWDDGLRDLITEYVDEVTVKVSYSETTKSASKGKIEPEVYAYRQHEISQTLVILAGTKLYRAIGVPPMGWVEIPGCMVVTPYPSMSKLKDDRGDMILLNASGFFRIKLGAQCFFYKLNEDTPREVVTEAVTAGLRYEYRYFYTCSLILGLDPLFLNRMDDTATLDHECAASHQSNDLQRDYATVNRTTAISSASGYAVLGFALPFDRCAYSHFSVYRTKSITDIDVARGNNKNIPVWVEDFPVAKGLLCSITFAGRAVCSKGQVRRHDLGSYAVMSDGRQFLITAIYSDTEFQLSGITDSYTNVALAIGAREALQVSIDGDALTVTSGRELTSADENKLLFLDTSYVLIKKVLSTTTATLAWENSVDVTGAAIDLSMGRNFNDTTDDTTLQARIESKKTDHYILRTRFMKPMPDCTIFDVANGWIFGAKPNEATYYYGDITRKQHAGYYRTTKQYCDTIQADITQILGYPDMIIMRCRNSTYTVQTTITMSDGDPLLGDLIQMLKDPILKNPELGVISQFDSGLIPGGKEVVFCSDKTIRFFDGNAYSEPIDTGSVGRAKIKKFRQQIIIASVRSRGLIFWGR